MEIYVVRVVAGPARGRELQVTSLLELGRDPSLGLPLDDGLASERHARLLPGEGGLVLEDLGSGRATFVNGTPITAPTLVRPGDLILIGETTIEVRGPAPAEYVLRVSTRGGPIREILLGEPLEVGRDPSADLALVDDEHASRRHARLTPRRDGIAIEDLGSSNGTFVNGVPVGEPTLLQAGDRILVGDTMIDVLPPALSFGPADEGADFPVPIEATSSAQPAAAVAEAAASPVACVLEVVGAKGTVSVMPLGAPVEVGRDPSAGLALADDQLVSRAHASLTPTSEGVLVCDLGSRNGTFVHGVRIEAPTLVRSGDRIRVGDTTIIVRCDDGGGNEAAP